MAKEIHEDEVQKIAKLARLNLSVSEVEEAIRYMGDILGYMELLKEVETDSVEPYSPATILSSDMRDDMAVHFSNRKGLLQSGNFNSNDLLVTKGIFNATDDE